MEEHTKRCLEILNELKSSSSHSDDEKIQKELAAIVGLIPSIERTKDITIIETADLALKNLTSDNPKLMFAKELRAKLERNARLSTNPFRKIFFSNSPAVRVILGLGFLLYIAIPLSIVFLDKIDAGSKILGVEQSMLITVALSGAIGSIVSIMVRIRDFSDEKNLDPAILFFTGMFKPIVGLSFALFIFSLIKGKLIPIDVQAGSEHFFFIALAFVSGFSERFAKDAVAKVEGTVIK